ncbi:molybdopterin molybdotransferase MoeA [Pseudogemmobacter sp. W21_MBD1_M6]|uniref:molybdopterin molybdotransferase MoeA n=1 Tax=Pseudogemmobacter sp. W21_MBD1_M6 TaxID=3240271 RepID=UPI003F9BB3FF
MITVSQALSHVFDLVRPLDIEHVPLAQAAGRTLAAPLTATRNQPPFASSAMDGYAVRNVDVAAGAVLHVIAEAAAGHAFDGVVGAGQAVRIFTGAPVPAGADRIVIQEDVTRSAETITIVQSLDAATHVRPAGGDFTVGHTLTAPCVLGANDMTLIAAMNIGIVPVTRRPVVALIATGDELVMPGEAPRDDQIIASNCFGLKAMIEANGGIARILPIARDTGASLRMAFDLAASADLIVTIGGASVGDYDIVSTVATDLGMERAFYTVALRPGKPLMAGRINGIPMIGLPGNPVSSMVCGHIFIRPVLDVMRGLPARATPRVALPLARPLSANGPREHYMRAHEADGAVTVFDRQDSSLMAVLAGANVLVVRPVGDAARVAGDLVDVIRL